MTLPSRIRSLTVARDVLDGDVRVDAVLIEEIDPIGLEPLQRCVGDFPDVRRPAIEPRLLAAFELEPELRGDDHLIAERRQRFADEFFVGERPVGFGGVEEGDATVDSAARISAIPSCLSAAGP